MAKPINYCVPNSSFLKVFLSLQDFTLAFSEP